MQPRLYAWSAFVAQGIRMLDMEAPAGRCSISRLRLEECADCVSGLHPQLRGERPTDQVIYGPTRWAKGALRFRKMRRPHRVETMPIEFCLESRPIHWRKLGVQMKPLRYATTGEIAQAKAVAKPRVIIRKARKVN